MSRRPRREAWKTFTVRVTEVRGQQQVYASVELSHVSGVDHRPYRPVTVWEGVVAIRDPGEHLEADEAAEMAASALRRAYPGLF